MAEDHLFAGQVLQIDHIGHRQVVFQFLHLPVKIGLSLLGRCIFRVFRKIPVSSGDLNVLDVLGDGDRLENLQFPLQLCKSPLGDGYLIHKQTFSCPDS
jgi:hypothetical protein